MLKSSSAVGPPQPLLASSSGGSASVGATPKALKAPSASSSLPSELLGDPPSRSLRPSEPEVPEVEVIGEVIDVDPSVATFHPSVEVIGWGIQVGESCFTKSSFLK